MIDDTIPEASWDWLMGLSHESIFVAEMCSMERVPPRVVGLVGQCHRVSHQRILANPDDESGWRLWHATASMLLSRPARGTTSTVGTTERVRRRCRAFLAGEWASLLVIAEPGAGFPARPVPPAELTLARVYTDTVRLVVQGQARRAMTRLDCDALAAPTEATFAALQALHPASYEAFRRPDVVGEPPLALVVTLETFHAVMRSLPRASGPGTTQWRFEHLQALYFHGCDREIYDICMFIIAGRIPIGIRPWFAGARLVALCKDGRTQPPEGGVRPIACGEVLRRVCGRLVSTTMAQTFSAYFAHPPAPGCRSVTPVQLGVAVPGGQDIMVHTVQALVELHPDWACASIDIENAFNSVSRSVIAGLVLERFP